MIWILREFAPDLFESVSFSVFASGAILRRMARFTDTVMVKDGGRERAVRVTIDAPLLENLDIPTLAQAAWIKPGKILKVGNVRVKVEKFSSLACSPK